MLRSSLDFVRPFPWQNIKPASLQAHPGEAQIFQVARSESPALKSSTGCALATRRRLARVNEKITDAAADCGRGESSDGWPRVTRNRWRNPDAHEEFTAPDSALEGPILKASFQLHFNFQDEERMLPLELIFRQLQHRMSLLFVLNNTTVMTMSENIHASGQWPGQNPTRCPWELLDRLHPLCRFCFGPQLQMESTSYWHHSALSRTFK